MKCSDLHLILLRRRLAVIDVATPSWKKLRVDVGLASGVHQQKCLERMLASGMLRRVKRGVYQVVDPTREVPPIAVASATYGHRDHYVTTDAALKFHELIDQPVPEIVVCVPRGAALRPFKLDAFRVRASEVSSVVFDGSDHYRTTADRFPIEVATRAQAVVDALDSPRSMRHFSLLPELLRSLDRRDVEALSQQIKTRSQAASQRLGYLLEEAGVGIPRALASVRPSAAVELRPGTRTGVFSTRWRVYG